MNYDDLSFKARLAGRELDYETFGLDRKGRSVDKTGLWYSDTGVRRSLAKRGGQGNPVPVNTKKEFRITHPDLRDKLYLGLTPSKVPGAPAGSVAAALHINTGKFFDSNGRSIHGQAVFDSLTPKQALAFLENIKSDPKLAELLESDAFYDRIKTNEVQIKPEKVKEVLDKWLDTSKLKLKPGQTIRIFDDPEQRAATLARRKENYDKLKGLLKIRKFRGLGLLTAGAGAAGTAGSLLDDKDRMLSAGLSTAAGAAALPTGLAAFGGKKLNRLITRKPLLGLATGALGGLGGFFGNKTVQDSLQKNPEQNTRG